MIKEMCTWGGEGWLYHLGHLVLVHIPLHYSLLEHLPTSINLPSIAWSREIKLGSSSEHRWIELCILNRCPMPSCRNELTGVVSNMICLEDREIYT